MTEDEINKIETLIGYVEAAGKGKYHYGNQLLLDIAEEATEWINSVKDCAK